MFGAKLVLGGGEPRGRSEELCRFCCAVTQWDEEAAEECLHYLDHEVKVTLEL